MSDFEHNIRASWQEIFPEVQAKGCHFHYAKVSKSVLSPIGLFFFYKTIVQLESNFYLLYGFCSHIYSFYRISLKFDMQKRHAQDIFSYFID